MERGGDDRALADGDRAALPVGEYLHILANRFDQRRANEHRRKRLVKAGDVEGCLEAILLAAEGVAVDRDIQSVQRLNALVLWVAGGNNQPRTGRQDRLAAIDVSPDLLVETLIGKQPGDRRRLPTWQKQHIAVVDEPGLADRRDLGVDAASVGDTPDRGSVFTHIALDSNHANMHTGSWRAGDKSYRIDQATVSVSTCTKTPKRTQNAITVFGSIRIALRSSESKYRTNPALDISPPEFPLEAIISVRHRDGLSVSASSGAAIGRQRRGGNPYGRVGAIIGRTMTVRLTDFYADWCGPCKTQDPILEELEADYEDVEFAKVDVDEEQEVANEYQVRSLPTLVIENDDGIVERFVGVTQRGDLENALQDADA